MFAKKILQASGINFTGARGTLTILYRTLCILLFGCLLALYGSTNASSSTVWWFSDHFFCLVCGPLEKKSLLGLIKHVGVFLALCGVCACALMQVLLLPIGHGFHGPVLGYRRMGLGLGDRWAYPGSGGDL